MANKLWIMLLDLLFTPFSNSTYGLQSSVWGHDQLTVTSRVSLVGHVPIA